MLMYDFLENGVLGRNTINKKIIDGFEKNLG
jgi:hypothetical protein